MSSVASSSAVGPPPGMRVRLSSNESPLGPSILAADAARAAVDQAHRYPDDQAVGLREALARHEDVNSAQVTVGTGSAAIIMDAVAHAATRGEVVAFDRSFIVYRLAAANVDARYREVETAGPATLDAPGYGRDVEALLAAVGPDTRVVAIDNPGNPTGAHLTGDELSALVDGVPDHVMILVDEAYHQFARGQDGYATVAELELDHPGLVVLRTFSKAYGLAGMRVGYLTGPAELVGAIDARRARFNVAAPSQAAATASLTDLDHLVRVVDMTVAGRARMADGLRLLGVPVTEGLGNFVTVELGVPSRPVVEAFARHGVGVRDLLPYGMTEQIRVSVGTESEVDAFLAASADVLSAVVGRP